MKYLSDYTAGRDNNFNLVRFVAATAVLVSHGFALATGDAANEPLRRLLGLSLGDIAVGVFFVTSGFLVTGSLITKQNVKEFFLSRALRIYPGLWLAVLLSVLICGFLFSELSPREFFTHKDTWRYLATNMAMLGRESYTLPGTFANLPAAGIINGSLWSLPVEIRMYLLLGAAWIAISLFCVKPAHWLKAICFLVAVITMGVDLEYLWANASAYEAYQSPAFAELIAAFFSGAALRAYADRIPVSKSLVLAIIGLLFLSAVTSGFLWVYKISFAYIVLYFSLVPRTRLLQFNQFGDYSYGMYIYAFVVQQIIISLHPAIHIYPFIALSLIVTMILAATSWHLIEKRALRLRKNFN
jgi:peptidoglycan/LPS O-acetylase OafA/YrhL